MSQATVPSKKPVPETPAVSEDLSKAIEQSVEKQPDEQVKTVRLFDDYYRCNWWVMDKGSQPAWLSSGKIRRSTFFRARRGTNGLQIEDMGKRTPAR